MVEVLGERWGDREARTQRKPKVLNADALWMERKTEMCNGRH
jgi:hypothetical protein